MDVVAYSIAGLFLALGAFVAITGGVGALRMPDFFTRCHCAGKGDTLAQLFIMIALILIALVAYPLSNLAVFKLFFISIFILVTSPTATHAVARGARHDGLVPWKSGDPRR